MGTQMAIPDQLLEILRTLHSFIPSIPARHVQPTYSATTAANLSPSEVR